MNTVYQTNNLEIRTLVVDSLRWSCSARIQHLDVEHLIEATTHEVIHQMLDNLKRYVKVERFDTEHFGEVEIRATFDLPYISDKIIEEQKNEINTAQEENRRILQKWVAETDLRFAFSNMSLWQRLKIAWRGNYGTA